MSRTPGQVAFEAYNESKGCKTWDGKDIPPWSEVGEAVQAGWVAAAEAVLDAVPTDREQGDAREPWMDSPEKIRHWQKAIHEYACDKGWWDSERSFGDICSLFHSEVSEAFEEYRNGHALDEVYTNPEKPEKLEGVPVELADVVIRICDFAQWAGIDLQAVMAQKHAFNLTRPHRHGGKKA